MYTLFIQQKTIFAGNDNRAVYWSGAQLNINGVMRGRQTTFAQRSVQHRGQERRSSTSIASFSVKVGMGSNVHDWWLTT